MEEVEKQEQEEEEKLPDLLVVQQWDFIDWARNDRAERKRSCRWREMN